VVPKSGPVDDRAFVLPGAARSRGQAVPVDDRVLDWRAFRVVERRAARRRQSSRLS